MVPSMVRGTAPEGNNPAKRSDLSQLDKLLDSLNDINADKNKDCERFN